MIHHETVLSLADNSGATAVQCIRIFGGTHKRSARIGDIIKVSVKAAIPRSRVKKGEIYNALVVRTRYGVRRQDGSRLCFDSNAAVLLNTKLEPIGTRIFGALPRELRGSKFTKILSLAPRGAVVLMNRLQQGDQVIVICGRDKGKIGAVISVDKNKNRLMVEGVGKVIRHQKPNPQANVTGGRVESFVSIEASNVMHYHPKLKKPSRIRIVRDEQSNKPKRVYVLDESTVE